MIYYIVHTFLDNMSHQDVPMCCVRPFENRDRVHSLIYGIVIVIVIVNYELLVPAVRNLLERSPKGRLACPSEALNILGGRLQ